MITLLLHGPQASTLRMTVRQAEEEAARLLETSWWPHNDLPVDPFALARGLGIAVRFERLPSDESGYITMQEDETPLVAINRADWPSRQRFTVAHEIGHYVWRTIEPGGPNRFVDRRATLAGLGVEPREIFANQFAAALLMPASRVIEYHRQRIAVEEMARRFGTSTQAMELRLKNLRLR